MLRKLSFALLLASPSVAAAAADELDPVPARAIIGHAYIGETAPSRILFINVRDRPVKIIWIGFDGVERPYATLNEGQEMVQPTFVGHRWLARDAGDGDPLAGFIATRSERRSNGVAEIAIIR